MYFSGCGEFKPPKHFSGSATVMFLQSCIHLKFSEFLLKSSSSCSIIKEGQSSGHSMKKYIILYQNWQKNLENDFFLYQNHFSMRQVM